MGELSLNGSNLGNALQQLLVANDITPGDDPSYQLCKAIFLYHPLGYKMTGSPVKMAQSQKREISVPKGPEERVVEAFEREWKTIGADDIILNLMTQSRIYGVAALACGEVGIEPNEPLDYENLADREIYFSVFDPLNTSGSLVLNQNPNAPDFQKHRGIAVSGKAYHRSRSRVVMNGPPIYIAYTTSAFGYVGRSVYQPALFPLRSFVATMVADDMVAFKAGLLVAKIKQPGSIIDNVMAYVAGIKRTLLKEAFTNNVISIDTEEAIETLNMTNTAESLKVSRADILENIAAAGDMPAKLLNAETFAEGFGEGTEDAKHVAAYIERLREEMTQPYQFMDGIVQRRAWNRDFYKSIQKDFPNEYGGMPFNQAFYEWQNSFRAEWPSLLTEPDSEKIKVEEVKYKTVIAVGEVMLPLLDPDNKAIMIAWMQDNMNQNKMLFKEPLVLDIEALRAYKPPAPAASAEDAAGEAPPPFSSRA